MRNKSRTHNINTVFIGWLGTIRFFFLSSTLSSLQSSLTVRCIVSRFRKDVNRSSACESVLYRRIVHTWLACMIVLLMFYPLCAFILLNRWPKLIETFKHLNESASHEMRLLNFNSTLKSRQIWIMHHRSECSSFSIDALIKTCDALECLFECISYDIPVTADTNKQEIKLFAWVVVCMLNSKKDTRWQRHVKKLCMNFHFNFHNDWNNEQPTFLFQLNWKRFVCFFLFVSLNKIHIICDVWQNFMLFFLSPYMICGIVWCIQSLDRITSIERSDGYGWDSWNGI